MQSLPFPDGWIEGRGNGKESISLLLILLLLRSFSLSDVRCRRGGHPSYIWAGVESPFHPSLLLLLLPAPCHPARARPEMCCIRARGEEGALRDSVGLFEWVLNFIQLLLEERCPELLAHTANRSLVVILSLSSFSFLS